MRGKVAIIIRHKVREVGVFPSYDEVACPHCGLPRASGGVSTFEKIIAFTPIVQRFIRITDYGETEKIRQEEQERRQFRAIRRLERKE